MEVTQEQQKALSKAKIGLLTKPNSVFVTTILFSLKCVWCSDDDPVWGNIKPTAAVDGITMYINPTFFMALSPETRQTLLAHETWHVAFDHISRGMGYDPKIYNQAGDYVINEHLVKSGLKPIDGWLYDSKYHGMTTEAIYKLLQQDAANGNPEPSNSIGNDIKPSHGDSDKAIDIRNQVKEIITRANTAKIQAEQADPNKNCGGMPGEVDILIDEYLNPKLPWETILQKYMTAYDKDDYSFQRPNRRFMPDFYLPSLYSESMAEIALGFDTSCSVTHTELKQYLTEVDAIINRLAPKRVTVASFDHKLQGVDTLEKGDPISKVNLKGRGGTDLVPLFDYYKKHPPTVLIVFSDLECHPIPLEDRPNFDVIWICVSNPRAEVEFGKLIHVELSD